MPDVSNSFSAYVQTLEAERKAAADKKAAEAAAEQAKKESLTIYLDGRHEKIPIAEQLLTGRGTWKTIGRVLAEQQAEEKQRRREAQELVFAPEPDMSYGPDEGF